MSIINSQPLIGASGQGGAYNLTRSLRFRSSASAYLSRVPASAGNRQKWTFSAWVKRGTLGVANVVFANSNGAASNGNDAYYFNSDNNFVIAATDDNQTTTFNLVTTQVFRDPSAWYHIVVAFDTTQATSSNRIKLYVNGSQVTSFSSSQYPNQNYNTPTNRATDTSIGVLNYTGPFGYYDGYITEFNFIDGQQLDASSFGETDTATGVWKPKEYTGTYGTNGFYLKFDNLTSTSTLGNDSSGNSNTWTVNNISLTSGATYDSMKDVPTLTDADTANYCVLNPLDKNANITVSNANLTAVYGGAGNTAGTATIGASSGKWYFEYVNTGTANPAVGVTRGLVSNGVYLGNDSASYSYSADGNKNNNNVNTAYGATWTTNDIIGVALDLDAATLTFYKNNSSQGTAFSSLPSGTYFPAYSVANGATANFNFGQRPFAYTPPSGFKALNTFNLPTPTIGATASSQANKYFDIKTYTGTGSSLNITGLGFQPDLVWIKERNAAADHALYDAVRGVQKQLESNTTDAETTESTGLTAFNSDGFTVGALAQVNTNTDTYVAWAWDANGAGVSNTDGTITSTVSVNASAGFSIVTWTGTGSGNTTVGHGLGVAPKIYITKNRSSAADWGFFFPDNFSSPSQNKFMYLNKTDASGNASQSLPTSTVLSLNGGFENASGNNYVAYCFAEVAGYSKFGSYTGNGSTDGPFVYTGFKPKFVLIKQIDGTNGWSIIDGTRNPYNQAGATLFPYSSGAEDNSTYVIEDFLSNGFKIRISGTAVNASGGNYVYAAFSENPFKYSLAR